MVRATASGVHTSAAPNGQDNHRGFSPLASIGKPAPVSWLLPGFVPRSMLTLVQGDKGVGKSSFLALLAASVTGGARLPGQRKRRAEGKVFWLAGEEGYADLVFPRVLAAGGDADAVLWPDAGDGRSAHVVSFPTHGEQLADVIHAQGVKLLVIDPLPSFFDGGYSLNDEAHVRQILAPLVAVAASARCAIVATRHLRKTGAVLKAHRGMGSVAFSNAARSVLQLGRLNGDAGRFVLERVEGNCGPAPTPLAYELADAGDVARFVFRGEAAADDGNDLDALDAAAELSSLHVGRELLRRELGDGPKPVHLLKEIADKSGVSWRTMERAKLALGIRSKQVGRGRTHCSEWSLPPAEVKK